MEDLLPGESRRSPHMFAAFLRGLHPCSGALADEISFKFRQCAHDMEHQSAAASRGIDTVCQTLKTSSLLSQALDEVAQERGTALTSPASRRQACRPCRLRRWPWIVHHVLSWCR